MRKLLTVSLAALVAGTALVACDRLPQQPADTQGPEARASQGAAPSGMIAEEAWGNDHLWRFLIPKTVPARIMNSEGVMLYGHPSNEASLTTFYQIGPGAGDDGAQHPAPFPLPHDHVMTVPRKNQGSFTANCHLKAVFAAPGGKVATSGPEVELPSGETVRQAHAAEIDGDGELEDLTSAEKVREAADRGHVILLPTPLTWTCPVKDIEG